VAQRAPFPEVTRQRTVFSLPQQTFEFLEKPDYYFDAFHLNAKGRQRFTEKLVSELVSQLGASGQHGSYP
jgi:lysophospholipase L1-like esterase